MIERLPVGDMCLNSHCDCSIVIFLAMLQRIHDYSVGMHRRLWLVSDSLDAPELLPAGGCRTFEMAGISMVEQITFKGRGGRTLKNGRIENWPRQAKTACALLQRVINNAYPKGV